MDSSFSTQDLRAGNRDSKRDADSHHKWENGESWGPGRSDPAHPRPAKNIYSALRPAKLDKQSANNRAKTNRKREIYYDKAEATDSSADEATEPSAAPEPDAEITYSYDAARGPSHGSQVLGYALEQAFERFETKETEKLVSNEYLVLDSDGEAIPTTIRGKKPFAAGHNDDDDYEFV